MSLASQLWLSGNQTVWIVSLHFAFRPRPGYSTRTVMGPPGTLSVPPRLKYHPPL